MTTNLRIGLFGTGLAAYWPQFEGLRSRLAGYITNVAERLERADVELIDLGLISTAEEAFAAGQRFREAAVDLLFLQIATYAVSSIVLPVVRRAKAPVVVLNLAPKSAIHYGSFNRLPGRDQMTEEWLAFCQACPLPEIANVFRRAQMPFFQVTGTLGDDPLAWREIGEWVEAARVAHVMEENRLGVMGHYYGGMLDIYSDLTQHLAQLGGHIEFIEVEELATLRSEIRPDEIQERIRVFHRKFDIQPDCSFEELYRAARTSVALDRLVERHALGSLAYYYAGSGGSANRDAISSIILGTSLLTERGIPVAGEYEIKNAQAMKIMDTFEAGGSFTGFTPRISMKTWS